MIKPLEFFGNINVIPVSVLLLVAGSTIVFLGEYIKKYSFLNAVVFSCFFDLFEKQYSFLSDEVFALQPKFC